MKKIILLSSLLFSQFAVAGMVTKFLPLNRVLVIMADNLVGQPNDEDSKNLFHGLNVEENHQDQGDGKKIILENKNLVLLCVHKKTKDYTCNINLAKTANSIIVPSEKMFQYQLTGSQAEEVNKLFYTNADGIFYFESENSRLKISSTPSNFLIQYKE